MKTFVCNFGGGTTCTMTLDDNPPPAGSTVRRKCEWEGPKGKHLLRPYIAWTNSVNKSLADEWNVSFMHVFQVKPEEWDVWVYEPGKPPKKVEDCLHFNPNAQVLE